MQAGSTTYLIPRQLRGPLENETRYFSSIAESSLSHRSGWKVEGFGKISGFLCRNVAPIETTVCGTPSIMRLDGDGASSLTPAGTTKPEMSASTGPMMRGRGVTMPCAILNDSLMTAVWKLTDRVSP